MCFMYSEITLYYWNSVDILKRVYRVLSAIYSIYSSTTLPLYLSPLLSHSCSNPLIGSAALFPPVFRWPKLILASWCLISPCTFLHIFPCTKHHPIHFLVCHTIFGRANAVAVGIMFLTLRTIQPPHTSHIQSCLMHSAPPPTFSAGLCLSVQEGSAP